jgi:thioredoxin reductase
MLGRYARWLHLQWPAGTVETLPEVREDGSTNVPGLFVAGDLTGIPLLKLASDSGARVVGRLASDPAFTRGREKAAGDPVRDLVILGAGIAGMAAAIEAE